MAEIKVEVIRVLVINKEERDILLVATTNFNVCSTLQAALHLLDEGGEVGVTPKDIWELKALMQNATSLLPNEVRKTFWGLLPTFKQLEEEKENAAI